MGIPFLSYLIRIALVWETLVSVMLTEENGKTKLELRQTVSQELAKKTGAYPSWLQMLNNMRTLIQN
jgi:hypothetical protein